MKNLCCLTLLIFNILIFESLNSILYNYMYLILLQLYHICNYIQNIGQQMSSDYDYNILLYKQAIKLMSETLQESKASANINEFNKFLNNNAQFLAEKFRHYYGQPLSFADLRKTEQINKTIKFIYDIFSFQKYQSDPKLNTTLKNSIITNINNFLKTQNTDIFHQEMSVRLLKYCIEHNQMFAVHYDKKDKEKIKQNNIEMKQQIKQESLLQKKQLQQQQQQKQINEQNNEKNQQKMQQDVQQKVQQQQEVNNKKEQILIKQQVTLKRQQQDNEFEQPKKEQNNLNEQLFSRHAKMLFEFYCKQQQNVGRNSTFDKISYNCRSMTQGKFVAFAQACNLVQSRETVYSEARIDKKALIATFQKVAQNSKHIQFDEFVQILKDLRKQDRLAFDRLGLGAQDARVATHLKYFSLPFNTRDPHGRELKSRIFNPKLTAHSGLLQDALRDQLRTRKSSALRPKPKFTAFDSTPTPTELTFGQHTDRSRHTNLMNNPPNKQFINSPNNQSNMPMQNPNEYTNRTSLKDNSQTELKFLNELIVKDDNDEEYLQEYSLPFMNQRYQQKLKKQTPKEEQMLEYLVNRQHAIVPNMQKRIKDLQSKEKKITAVYENKFRYSLAK